MTFKLKIIISLILCSYLAQSQNPTITWGTYEYADNRTQEIGGNMHTFVNNNIKLIDGFRYVISTNENKLSLDKIDLLSGNLISKTELDYTIEKNIICNISLFTITDNTLKVNFNLYNTKKSTYSNEITSFEMTTGKKLPTPVVPANDSKLKSQWSLSSQTQTTTYEVKTENKTKIGLKNFNSILNTENPFTTSLSGCHYNESTKTATFPFSVRDRKTLAVTFSDSIQINSSKCFFEVNETLNDNDGNIFFLFRGYDYISAKSNLKTYYQLKYNETSLLVSYNAITKKFNQYDLSKFITNEPERNNLYFKLDPINKKVHVGRICNNEQGTEAKLISYVLDYKNQGALQLSESVLPETTAKMYSETRGNGKFNSQCYIDSKSGDVVFLSEFTMVSTNSSTMSIIQQPSEIYVFRLSNSGNLKYAAVIPKKQNLAQNFSSYVVISYSDKVRILFNDNKDNMELKKEPKLSDFYPSFAVLVTIDENGTFSKTPVKDFNLTKNECFAPDYTTLDKNGNILVAKTINCNKKENDPEKMIFGSLNFR